VLRAASGKHVRQDNRLQRERDREFTIDFIKNYKCNDIALFAPKAYNPEPLSFSNL
jgi:hypothetical protein